LVRFFSGKTGDADDSCAAAGAATGVRWELGRGILRRAAALTASLALLAPSVAASPGADSEGDGGIAAFYQPPVQELVVGIADVADLSRRFVQLGYHLDHIRSGAGEVPRLLLANLPGDMPEIKTIETRKALFIQAILPLILRANEQIAADRELLKMLLARPSIWSDVETVWVAQIAGRYSVDQFDHAELLRRVDVIPTSLALAQAAEESGWGTSRFAIAGNAVFGVWTYDPDKGLVPISRNEGRNHLVRAYDGLLGSVAGYMLNLNTHDAYNAFRNRRAQMRTDVGALDAPLLANTLIYYSEGRRDYTKRIRDIIEINALTAFDDARLSRELRGLH
jgi:Bax protein